MGTLQKALAANVMREFELLGTSEDKPNPMLLERLRSCCLVVDALGYKVAGMHTLLTAFLKDLWCNGSPWHFAPCCSPAV